MEQSKTLSKTTLFQKSILKNNGKDITKRGTF